MSGWRHAGPRTEHRWPFRADGRASQDGRGGQDGGRTDELAMELRGLGCQMLGCWIMPARRRLSVPELRAVELHECDRDSGARAAQSPQPEHGRRGQPGSLRIMNHDGTRLSCLSHGSIEAKPTGGGGCGRADGPGPERGERRPRADDAALRCRGRRVWVLKPRSSSISTV